MLRPRRGRRRRPMVPHPTILTLILFSSSTFLGAQPSAAPQKPAEPSLQPQVVLETTKGDIIVELDAERAPVAVLNFVDYAQGGFYNDTIFHRVVKGRMIHGGGYAKDLKLKEIGLRAPVLYEGGNGLLHNEGT